MSNRIGVYVCYCGENIGKYVDVEKVKDEIANEEGVALAKTTMFACADSSQKEMINDIKENNLDGLVVASCSPKLHLYTFRNVALRAGLNPYNYTQANIREQTSWAHSNTPKEATEKAISVVKAAIARTRFSDSLTPPTVPAENVALVIGAGIAGMRTAIELADTGTDVYLIEKNHFVGGRTSQWGQVFRTNQKGSELVKSLYEEISKRTNINLFTGTEMVSKSGSVGNFEIKLRIKPRYFKPQAMVQDKEEFKERIRKAIEICPEQTYDEFNFRLTKRKAIYINHEGEFPELPAIDDKVCTFCNKCIDICKGIDLNQKEEFVTIKAGAIILSVGFDPYTPKEGEFGYKSIDNVITLPEFRRLMEINKNGQLYYKDKKINNISYIYCVGARQLDGDNKYCSRYCCATTVHTSILAKSKFKNINNFHFHRGMRAYGKLEPLYQEASTNGDLFFQSKDDELPTIEVKDGKTIIKIKDMLTLNQELEIESDLVVLVTAMVPRKNGPLTDLLKVPVGKDKFFKEIHPKLKPVETIIDGVFLAGTCNFPRNIMETINSSLAASVKASALISKGHIELEPILAKINEKLCTGSGECIEVCPYNAIQKIGEETVPTINKAICKGCGMCLPVCPNNAIELIGYTDKQIESLIDDLANV
jgi:heterodisulfide reductase subunit A2